MKILICGLPGAGKTWLAERLIKVIDNCAWYNADIVRSSSGFFKRRKIKAGNENENFC